ncbi:MAG: PepSY domain-containing protein, partial [Kiloniellaceae bacterium]
MKRLTAVHGWSGAVLGLLLYAVVVTGTVAVFAQEIAVWSAGGTKAETPLSAPLDRKVRDIADRLTKGYLDRIAVFADARGDLLVAPHTRARNPETDEPGPYGPLYQLDAETGVQLDWHQGFLFDHPDWFE